MSDCVFEDNEACFTDPQSQHLDWNCLTGLIWKPKNCANPLHGHQNIRLADMLNKGNFTRDELRTFFFICSISVRFSSTCWDSEFRAWWAAPQWRKGLQDQRWRRRKGCVQVATSSDEYFFFYLRQCSSTASSPIASKSPGMPIASGETRQQDEYVNAISFDDSVDVSSATEGCIPWRLDGKAVGETRRINEEEDVKKTHRESILQAEILCIVKKNLLPKTVKLGGNPLHTEPVLPDVTRKVQKDTEATWDHNLQVSPNTSHYMEAVFSTVRKIYGEPPGDQMENLNVNWAIWGMFMNTTLFEQAVRLGKDCDMTFKFCKEFILWKTTGQLFREIEKLISGQTESTGIRLINLQDFKVGIDKLIAQSSLPMFHCQSLCLLRFCTLFRERWEMILLNPGRSKFQWYSDNELFQRVESKWWTYHLWNSSGRFSQDSLQWESSIRFNWWWENHSVNQRTSPAGSSSCQCLTTLYGMKKELMNYVCK